MPIGDFVNNIPAPVFVLIHLTAFAIGAYFAWRSFGAGASTLGWAFSLFALAEISYGTTSTGPCPCSRTHQRGPGPARLRPGLRGRDERRPLLRSEAQGA